MSTLYKGWSERWSGAEMAIETDMTLKAFYEDRWTWSLDDARGIQIAEGQLDPDIERFDFKALDACEEQARAHLARAAS